MRAAFVSINLALAAFIPFAAAAAQPGALHIVVIEGEDAVNVVQQKTAVAPVVEVRDRNDQPVAGAVVRFAIQRGQATFNGARTLTVTSNAAGRAAVTGLTPTGTGALEIGASTSFQGQTAVVTIAQNNVATAGAAAAGASTAGSAGGGVSGMTLGIIGAAAAGGTLVALKATGAGGGGSSTTYTGAFSGPFTMTYPACPCSTTFSVSGTVTLHLDTAAGGAVSGTAEVSGTRIVTQVNGTQAILGATDSFHGGPAPATGKTDSLAFTSQESGTLVDVGFGPRSYTQTFTFAGALNGAALSGTLGHTTTETGGNSGSGSTSYTVGPR